MLHPIFQDILKPFSDAVNSNNNSHLTEFAQNSGKPEEIDAFLDAIEQAEREISFDDMVQALADFPEDKKAQALKQAVLSEPTEVLAETFERLMHQRLDKILPPCVRNKDWQDFEDLGGDAA